MSLCGFCTIVIARLTCDFCIPSGNIVEVHKNWIFSNSMLNLQLWHISFIRNWDFRIPVHSLLGPLFEEVSSHGYLNPQCKACISGPPSLTIFTQHPTICNVTHPSYSDPLSPSGQFIHPLTISVLCVMECGVLVKFLYPGNSHSIGSHMLLGTSIR